MATGRSAVWLGLGLGAVLVAADPGQSQVFRAGVDLVELRAAVTDRDGRPVRGLTQQDFEIFEDRRLVTTVAFTPPLEALIGAPTMAAPNVSGTVRTSNLAAAPTRVFVVVLDVASFGFLPSRWARMRDAANQLIRGMRPSDLAAVIAPNQTSVQADFTSDQSRLLNAVERARPRGGAADPGIRADVISVDSFEEQTLELLAAIASRLAGVEATTKAVVFISEGPRRDMLSPFVPGSDSNDRIVRRFREAIRQAQLAGVAIYPLDPSGLHETGGSEAQANLRILADQTGGLVGVNHNNLAAAAGRVLEDTAAVYRLSFYSARADGKPHDVEVRVRRPGLSVRTVPRSFAKPTTAARRTLNEVLAAALPVRELPLRVVAIPALNKLGRRISVGLMIEARLDQVTLGAELSVAAVAIDLSGRVRAEDRFALRAQAAGHDARWARIAARLDLEPGRYVIRVAALLGDAAGSVFDELDVPEPRRVLSLGGLMLATTGPTGVARAGRVLDVLGAFPFASPVLPAGTSVVAAVQVRGPQARSPLSITTTLADEAGVTQVIDEREISPDSASSAAGLLHSVRIPHERLRPGGYEVIMSARTPAGEHAQRAVRFVVSAK